MAFFLESTFVGLFFFGWNRLTRLQHLAVTWLTALGANLSALWILIANGWMQNPVGAEFNFQTMRMEITDFAAVVFNPVAQAKFVHTVSAGYVTGAMFVLSVSAWYLLRNRNLEFAKRSMAVAASFGLAAALSTAVLGDESGYTASKNQRMKIAAIEAEWHTQPAPAAFTAFGLPSRERRGTAAAVRVPWALGVIATRSLDEEVPGIHELVEENKVAIRNGIAALQALKELRADPTDVRKRLRFLALRDDLGFGLLTLRYVRDPAEADESVVERAAWDTVPNVPVLFWSFRIMVGLGFFFIALFGYAFYLASTRRLQRKWFLRIALWSLPLPWVAAELGWIVAEYGRQPWAIDGVLPTFLGVSSTSSAQVVASLAGFVLLYTGLLVVDVLLMLRAIRSGPDRMGLWPASGLLMRPGVEPAKSHGRKPA
jgi:cytochrome d ubiquinol oxidase subunit I